MDRFYKVISNAIVGMLGYLSVMNCSKYGFPVRPIGSSLSESFACNVKGAYVTPSTILGDRERGQALGMSAI